MNGLTYCCSREYCVRNHFAFHAVYVSIINIVNYKYCQLFGIGEVSFTGQVRIDYFLNVFEWINLTRTNREQIDSSSVRHQQVVFGIRSSLIIFLIAAPIREFHIVIFISISEIESEFSDIFHMLHFPLSFLGCRV